ncbi:MAG: HNH endonuclease signature motif containing protein [Ekhidna sp.]
MTIFNDKQLEYFQARQGAFSQVTIREASGDKAVTIDRDEKNVLSQKYPLDAFTRRGGAQPDGKPSRHVFNILNPRDLSHNKKNLSVTYPKRQGNELRLYFNVDSGFYPTSDQVWFIFVREGEDVPFVGCMEVNSWENLFNDEDVRVRQFEISLSIDEDDDEFQKAVNSPKPPAESHDSTVTKYKRDIRVSKKALESAEYKCEFDPEHETFTSLATGMPYMELHHLVPISTQSKFDVSLDVESNIVALCPQCHREIHFGADDGKKEKIDRLLDHRGEAIHEAGIEIEREDLYKIYGMG